MNTYSQSFKESLARKVLTSDQSLSAVAREANISTSTLHAWVQKLKKSTQLDNQQVKSPKKINSWSNEEKLQILIATNALDDKSLSSYCRQHGLYQHQLKQWQQEFIMSKPKDQDNKNRLQELKRLKEQNKKLQRELQRKEKALAEASALLLLKKKADLIWPVNEDD